MSTSKNPMAIDAKAFYEAVNKRLGSGRSWQSDQNPDDKLSFQLDGGKTWTIGGGEGKYGSGVYKYEPWSAEDQAGADAAQANYDALGGAEGSWNNPANIGVGTGGKSDRDNMLESWKVAELGGYDPTKPIYRVRGDMSDMLGKDESRMFLDTGYQEVDGQMVPIGSPSRTYQASNNAENWDAFLKAMAFLSAGSSLAATAGGGAATAGGAGAYTTAAADSQAANAALGSDALAGYGAAGGDWMSNLSIADVNKAANAAHSAGEGDVKGAIASYVTPGMLGLSGDMGLGTVGNKVATSALTSAISGKDPAASVVSSVVGQIPGMEYVSMIPGAKAAVVGAITSALKGGASEAEAVTAGKQAASQAQQSSAEGALTSASPDILGGASSTPVAQEDTNPWRDLYDVGGEGIFQTQQAVKSKATRS